MCDHTHRSFLKQFWLVEIRKIKLLYIYLYIGCQDSYGETFYFLRHDEVHRIYKPTHEGDAKVEQELLWHFEEHG